MEKKIKVLVVGNNDKSPCLIKGCDLSTRQSCCGCPEWFEWYKRQKEKQSDAGN